MMQPYSYTGRSKKCLVARGFLYIHAKACAFAKKLQKFKKSAARGSSRIKTRDNRCFLGENRPKLRSPGTKNSLGIVFARPAVF
jgi:hypothetical protein